MLNESPDVPITTPMSSRDAASMTSPESAMACFEAASANWAKRPLRRAV
jgi:hypothetical protein